MNDSEQIRVLVLGLGENGLGILRALCEYGKMQLWAISFSVVEPAIFSRLARVVRWPDSAEDPDGFQIRLRSWSREHGNTVLFPTRDVEVNLLADLSDLLPSNLIFYRNSADKVSALSDKALLAKLASELGLSVPRTVSCHGGMNLSCLGLQYPVIIKPRGLHSHQLPCKNFLVSSEGQLREVLSRYRVLMDHAVLQEYIPGGDHRVYQCNLLFGPEARVIGAIEFHKIRQYLPGRGIASYGETTLGIQLIPFCLRLAKAVEYQGLMSVEFKKDPRTGRWCLIENNLRLPSYNAVFPLSGVNLAHIYVLNLIKQQHGPPLPRRIAVWMNEDLDLANVLTHKVNLKMLTWISQAIRTDSFAYCHRKDPLPALYCIGRILYKCFKRQFLKR